MRGERMAPRNGYSLRTQLSVIHCDWRGTGEWLRKLRWSALERGKRGGVRLIYH